MPRLLAFGDLHLGAGTSLGRQPGDRLRDQIDALGRIGGIAIEHQADAILVAGDTFEGPQVTPEQLDAFARFVDAMRTVGIPVVAVSGNGQHDSAMRAVNGVAIFQHVPGVDVYSTPAVHHVAGVNVACLPWVSPARLIAQEGVDADRDQVNETAARLLVQVAAGLREACGEGPSVLMLHGSISGASLPAGLATDELREPVMDELALLDLGYDAIVAAHIHVPQFLNADAFWAPPHELLASGPQPGIVMLYTGSPLSLNFGETGVPHGCWILSLDRETCRAEFVPIESRPLKQTTLDLAALAVDGVDPLVEFDGILDANAWPDVDRAIVKVSLRATQTQHRRLDLARLRDAVLAAGAHTVKIDVETVRQERSRVDGVTEDLDPLSAFDAWAAANEVDPELSARARDQMSHDLEAVGA